VWPQSIHPSPLTRATQPPPHFVHIPWYQPTSELQRRDLGMWRHASAHASDVEAAAAGGKTEEEGGTDAPQYVHAPCGLFPAVLPPDASSTRVMAVLERFHFAGAFTAKAMQDNVLLDLPLSLPFCRRLRGDALSLQEVGEIDEDVGRSLEWLARVAAQYRAALAVVQQAEDDTVPAVTEARATIAKLRTDIEGMWLDFTFMGRDDIRLRRRGTAAAAAHPGVVSSIDCTPSARAASPDEVTLENLEEYLELTVRAFLLDTIAPQLRAFMTGFAKFASLRALRVFTSHEICSLFSSSVRNYTPWRKSDLEAAIVCSHGYSIGDRQVQQLLDVLCGLDAQEQRLFMRFVTGAPRLPIGGFAALRPRLQVVRAVPPAGHIADELFPTCMVCEVYLKLPAYSSGSILRDKLLVAIREGQEHFAFD